jgi:hypothetical protein
LWTRQQIWPALQQLARQQPPPAPQSAPLQGAVSHWPAEQIWSRAQSVPHAPQLAESVVVSMQWSNPGQQT